MYTVKSGNVEIQIELNKKGDLTETHINGKAVEVDSVSLNDKEIHVLKSDQGYSVEVVSVDHNAKKVELKINGATYNYEVKDEHDLLLKELGFNTSTSNKVSTIKAPMPGLVLDVLVEDGQEIKKGDALIILEAMKMENIIKSPTDGIIKTVAVTKGLAVDKNELLIQLK
jgi:biotin carboxyl carrier protein